MIKQDISENQVKPIYLGIGSNLGNRIKNIEYAKFKLLQNDIRILQSSNYYESLSWPNPKKPKFINIILEVFTNHSPLNLLKKCKRIEIELGRKKTPKNSPRECDIDIIDYKNEQFNQKVFLPHPRMHVRNFVLLPLFELNKYWKHPVLDRNIKKLISKLDDKDIRSIKQI